MDDACTRRSALGDRRSNRPRRRLRFRGRLWKPSRWCLHAVRAGHPASPPAGCEETERLRAEPGEGDIAIADLAPRRPPGSDRPSTGMVPGLVAVGSRSFPRRERRVDLEARRDPHLHLGRLLWAATACDSPLPGRDGARRRQAGAPGRSGGAASNPRYTGSRMATPSGLSQTAARMRQPGTRRPAASTARAPVTTRPSAVTT